jgi:hypothetical protein
MLHLHELYFHVIYFKIKIEVGESEGVTKVSSCFDILICSLGMKLLHKSFV